MPDAALVGGGHGGVPARLRVARTAAQRGWLSCNTKKNCSAPPDAKPRDASCNKERIVSSPAMAYL